MIASLSGCGVGVENNDQYTAQQRKDAKALNDRFDRVRGTYEGSFANPDAGIAPHKARLLLYVVNVREGANPDGTLRVRPALYGRFQLVDAVGQTDYLSMQGDYDELGAISMTSLTSTSTSGGGTTGGTGGGTSGGTGAGGSTASSGDTATISIAGTIGNDGVTVDVSNTGGLWGRFIGNRKSQDAAAPTSSDALELRQRLLMVYRNIEGSYNATVDTGAQRIPISMTISIAENGAGGTGVSIPYLVAQYRRLDFPAGIGERQLAVNYDQLSGRISLNQVGSSTPGGTGGGQTGPPGSTYFAGSGTWINNVLDVVFRDRNGYAGELKATRKPYRD